MFSEFVVNKNSYVEDDAPLSTWDLVLDLCSFLCK